MFRKTCPILAALLMLPVLVLAQGITTASLNGTVISKSGEPLVGANVTAVHGPTGTVFGAASRSDGRFNIAGIKVGGPYTVTTSYIGYKKIEYKDLYLELGQDLRINFELQEEAIEMSEIVTVAERDPVLSSSRTGAAQSVSTLEIERLPSIQRSIQDFARLSPQIFGTNIGSSDNTGGVNIGGKNNRFNNISLDGAIINDAFGLPASGTPGGQGNAQPISLDAIQEFQVAIAPYDIRQGGFTGGSINAITRSGTNQFSGSAYFFGRNETFTQDVIKFGGSELQIPDFEELQTGFRLGGPIVENNVFFFANGEIKRRNDPRIGIGSPLLPEQVTQADVNRVISIAQNTYGYNAGTGGSFTADTDDEKIFARLDFNLSNRHHLTVRHNYVNASTLRGVIRDDSELGLSTQGYVFGSKQNSTVAQLNSTIGDSWANEARLTFTTIRDKRNPESAAFPEVEIFGFGGGDHIVLGTETFSGANSLDQNILEITNDLSWFKGDHTFTFGTHNELFHFDNLFIRDFNGAYEFQSIDLFEQGLPSRYDYSFSATGNRLQSADWGHWILGFYAQDEWKANSKLNLTLGLRMDVPVFPDKPTNNENFAAQFPGRRTDEVPNGSLLFSPRIGFNYDLSGDRTTQIRGGTGIFTGRTVGVWLSNQYSNTGIEFTRLSVRAPSGQDFIPNFNFVADPNNQPTNFSAQTSEVNLTDKDFKFPQVWRSNLAVDRQLQNGLIGTLEFVYTKNINDIAYKDINQMPTGQTAFDGRPLYSRASRVSSDFTNVLLLDNTSDGYQYSVTAQVQKRLGQGFLPDLFGSLAYTFSQARDVNSGTSSQAYSNWRFNLVVDPNNPGAATANFEIPHRFLANLSYRFSFFEKFGTTLSAFYEGRSGRPMSYIYFGDANGDGEVTNDLLYVPRNESEIILTTNNWQALDSFISNDDVLNDARGSIVARNAAREPWVNQLDLRIAQEIPSIGGQRFELTLDILNVLNLLNSDWGQQKWKLFGDHTLLNFDGYDQATGKPMLRFFAPNDNNQDGKLDRDDLFAVDNLLSRWQMQLGLRYSF